MTTIDIKNNHFRFANTNYFVGNAQLMSIGSYGEKATPLFGTNKLELKGRVPAPKLEGKVKVAGPFELDSSDTTEAEFNQAAEGTIKVVGISVAQKDIYKQLKSRKLKLVQLFVAEEDMRRALNDSPRALDNLAGYGGDARVVHQLFVIMEASYATSFTAGRSYEISADAAGIVTITAKGGAVVSGKDKVTIAPGTGFAYLLLKLDWNKDKTKVDSTRVDEWGVN
jgi:hypothetical protein